MRIIRAMDRHQDDAQVQKNACGALMNLSLNNANKMTLAQAATAQIVIVQLPTHVLVFLTEAISQPPKPVWVSDLVGLSSRAFGAQDRTAPCDALSQNTLPSWVQHSGRL